MIFNSVEFLIFFPVTVLVYFLLPQKVRKYFLLAASCYFYMSFIPKYMLILVFTTVVDYTGALLIEKYNRQPKARSAAFLVAICLNIGMLIYFKYLGTIGDVINVFGRALSLKTLVIPEIVLPIGISFHTFQSMGYLIDVYRGKEKAERNFSDFALFLMYFPQLVAGPIERSSNLFSQLKAHHVLKADNIRLGGRKMLWGMFKKVVVADNLALFADAVFNHVADYSGLGLVIGVLAFTVQIYCDFSGYSDIAIGASKIMDIDLMTNFAAPYFSSSTQEFWRRWHISLSTWFRDYVYIPLGGNRVSKPRWVLNQMLTFTVSGIWHGAGFTYMFWGFLNGLYIVLSRLTASFRKRTRTALKLDRIPSAYHLLCVVSTFLLVSFSWIFFRANSFSDAFYVIGNLFGSTVMDFSGIPALRAYVSLGAVLLLFGVEYVCNYMKPLADRFFRMPRLIRLVCYALLSAIIIIFGAYDNKAFIYFQF